MKSRRLDLRLEEAEKRALERIAARHHRSVTQQVRHWIAREASGEEQRPEPSPKPERDEPPR